MNNIDYIKPSFVSPKGYKLWGNSRYLSYDYYLKNRFGCKVAKIPLNGGFTCPNRDGTVSTKGCLFCSEKGAGDFCATAPTISSQIIAATQKDFIYSTANKWSRVNKYIAYFQAFSSTYAPPDILRARYNQALTTPIDGQIVGLDIATRADCINQQVLDVLSEFNEKTFLFVELGLQTTNENVRKKENIGYDMEVFDKAFDELSKRNILCVVHLIFGLPDDCEQNMFDSVEYVKNKQPFGVKFHQLMKLHNTELAKMDIPILSQDYYAELVAKSIARLPESVTIHRLCSDASEEMLLEPKWSRDKIATINLIGHILKEKSLFQGCLL